MLFSNNRWFHGHITKHESLEVLGDRPEGTFLIRFSSIEGYYCLSLVNQKYLNLQQKKNHAVQHHRIPHNESGYIFKKQNYETLTDLITKTQPNQLPCPGSKYTSIFEEEPDIIYMET